MNKSSVHLKCYGEIAEIAVDITMIVNGIYSQIPGEEEKKLFKCGIRSLLGNDTIVWTEPAKGTGVYMVLPESREEESK